MSNHRKDDELTDWIRAVGRWKTRQRQLQSLITGIETILREREELLEEALWLQATARDADEHSEAEEAMSKALALAADEHAGALRKLETVYQTLADSHIDELFERPRMVTSRQLDDPVDEASRESFPASDPPSFNG